MHKTLETGKIHLKERFTLTCIGLYLIQIKVLWKTCITTFYIYLFVQKASSPAATELETIVMDWLGRMIGLPTEFLHSNEQTLGGGVIQVRINVDVYA